MTSGTRTVATAAGVASVIGIGMAALLILADESPETVAYSLATLPGLGGLLFVCAVASLPVSLPAGVLGGILVRWASSCQPGWW